MFDPALGHEPQDARGLFKHYIKDFIYGANDGLITTFAIVSGVAGAALQARIVLILGFANLLADGFSMGASNFLAIRSEQAVRQADRQSPSEPFPVRHALVTFCAFVLAGSVPLLSYVLDGGDSAYRVSTALTFVTLFVVGASRSLVTTGPWWRSGIEMLLVGALAAGVAFGVGALIAPMA